ncbi:MAG: radical SAM family heme chaperone HemW [Planctomycetota bacterium]|nr:radical SAM family heme chaperone HemW [Planctomycetota bacterium]
MHPRAAYIHVPFCLRRCGYCNFTVMAGRDDLVESYLQAMERELSWLETPREVDTLFFGGGTPTYLRPAQLQRLIALARTWFPLAAGYEFSVEANPADLRSEQVDVLVQGGVNRISLGVQSFDDGKLAVLERDHRRREIERAWDLVANRFSSVAIDLIFAAPGETPETWRADLQAALDKAPAHLSTYGLTFDKGAAFWGRRERGQLRAVDEEAEREMYELTIETLTQAGFEHYEVSNFARSGQRCRQNVTYWQGGSYFAAGPGAARFVAGWRETNHRSTSTYLKRVLAGCSPVAERERLGPADAARERLVFGLRMLEGVERARFREQTGFAVEDLVGAVLPDILQLGFLEDIDDRLRLTRRGLLVSDSIWPSFL